MSTMREWLNTVLLALTLAVVVWVAVRLETRQPTAGRYVEYGDHQAPMVTILDTVTGEIHGVGGEEGHYKSLHMSPITGQMRVADARRVDTTIGRDLAKPPAR